MHPVRSEITADARLDLALQYQWYADRADETIAERYLSAFKSSLERLARQPDLGSTRRFRDPRLQGMRSLPLDGAFRVHLLFYRVEKDVLVVFRVLHGMRDLPRRLLDEPGAE